MTVSKKVNEVGEKSEVSEAGEVGEVGGVDGYANAVNNISIFCTERSVAYVEWDMLRSKTQVKYVLWNKRDIQEMFIAHNRKYSADKMITWGSVEMMVDFLSTNFSTEEIEALGNINTQTNVKN
jgi:hypothetical protein